jgi:alpha-D-xyloside xylohydrolase
MLSSHSRLHGSNSYRVPWLIDDKAVDVVNAFTKRKCRLMPYLFGAAVEASRRGIPMMRAMMLEFPADPSAGYLDRQYMLGESLLVAPVFSDNGEITYYLPPGRWTHFLTGRTVSGPGWTTERYAVDSLPLFARPGSVIPVGARDDRPDYDFADGVTLRVYEPADGAEVAITVPDQRGEDDSRFTVRRTGTVVTAERVAGSKPWQVLLINRAAASVTGGAAETVSDGALVTPDAGSGRVEVTLA